MSEQMTTFDKAARKAAEAIERAKSNAPDEWFLIPITEMTEIITKHHADLAETFGLLCELAAITRNYFGCDDLYRIDGNPESRGKIRLTRDDYKAALYAKLNNPRIAALLAEKG